MAPGFTVPRQGYPLLLLGLGGFLIGFDTRMGGGCISGHGICGGLLILLALRLSEVSGLVVQGSV
ncbi:MAG: hypothetical protein PHI13_03605 [Methylococcales bacterium]|nr:hypothetical protein [Methylococcales bacterium]